MNNNTVKNFCNKLQKWYSESYNKVTVSNNLNTEDILTEIIIQCTYLWFLKELKIISSDLFDKQKIYTILKASSNDTGYFNGILQNVFFNGMKTNLSEYAIVQSKDLFLDIENFESLLNKIPYLDTELFNNSKFLYDNPSELDSTHIPNTLFFNDNKSGIIDLLSQYSFLTNEKEVSQSDSELDPEVLGTVFENLLAQYNPETKTTARKQSGSFYTPKEIVNYMVNESIVKQLSEKTSYHEDSIRNLVVHEKVDSFKNENNKEELVRIISRLKILDPACGSGAFPIGVIQRLVKVLKVLDSDNTLWKRCQQEIAEGYDKDFPEPTSLDIDKRLNLIEETFNQNNKSLDYSRKFFILVNNLYGIDIQPMAVQICKLRFYLSLLIEQEIDYNEINYGISYFPDLSQTFIVENALTMDMNDKNSKKPKGHIGIDDIM
jgi:hypothetical protein